MDRIHARGVSWWGLLYGGNTIGAVFGCLLAGFYLLRMYDVAAATWPPRHQSGGGGRSASRWRRAPRRGSKPDAAWSRSRSRPKRRPTAAVAIYVTIGLSGASALGAEVVWTRLMGMMLGSTVYVFSIILAVFLIGLAIGSTVGAWVSRSARPRLALGWCQILLTAGHRLDRVHDRGFAALLADRSAAQRQPLVHVPARHGALPVGDSAAGALVGREFPAGAGRRGRTRRGSREGGGKRLRRQYSGRDRGRAGGQPDSGALDRHAAVAASAAGHRRRQRVHGAHALRARSEIGGNFRIAGGVRWCCDGSAVRASTRFPAS